MRRFNSHLPRIIGVLISFLLSVIKYKNKLLRLVSELPAKI